jgi:uncharacterized membrane protein YoaK (UPF0700 family)
VSSTRLSRSTEDKQVVLLVVLTAVSGIVDSASYLGLGHVFTSNMSGNWVILAFALSGTHGLLVARPALSFAGFLVGTILAGRISRRHWGIDRAGWPSAVTASLILAAIIQLVVLLIWLDAGNLPSTSSGNVLALLLATSMGCQGGAVRLLGVADLPTTVITSTVTGLFGDSPLGTGSGIRWRRRASAVAAFFIGGLVGAGIGYDKHSLSLVAGIVVLVGVVAASRRIFVPEHV